MTESPHFLLVGSGFYCNRGCEAIVRGTMALLRQEFGSNIRATIASFGRAGEIKQQAATETDPAIRHVWLPSPRVPVPVPWSPAWGRKQLWRVCGRVRRACGLPWLSPNELAMDMDLRPLDAFASKADCALQIGGDNYSLDYGLPIGFMRIDRHLWGAGIPLVLWGASVGPFDAQPRFAKESFMHLRCMSGVFVRESRSCEYLRQHGVTANVQMMGDPAFMMEPVEPSESKVGFIVPQGAVGLNFGPLMARFLTKGDQATYLAWCGEIVKSVGSQTRAPIILVPHVTCHHDNDYALLSEVAAIAKNGADVFCVDDRLSAAETKWIISRCSIFAGARTHSTIAALSSGVPTLSLAYSTKAIGLNQDIFGSQEYCVHPHEFSPGVVSERIVGLYRKAAVVREQLEKTLPSIRAAARNGAALLRGIMRGGRASRKCECRVCKSR